MNKFETFLEEKIVPLATKLGANRFLASIRDGLILSMPLMIVGSFTLIITEFPVQAYQDFMLNQFGENWKWFGDVASSCTMGLSAIIAVVAIGYYLGKSYKRDPLMSGVLSLVSYFILLISVDGGFAAKDFGAKGLFVAIMTAVISVKVFDYILSKDIKIKMPEGVPPAVAGAFEALIPTLVVLPLFMVIRFIFSMTPWESAHAFVFNILQIPLVGLSDSYFGIVASICASHTLWFFGIHGASVVGAITGPLFQSASLANYSAFTAGMALPHIVTQQFWDTFQGWGGVGATLPLSFIMIFFCKSKRIKTLGKLTMGPGIFGINEPMVFGLPLVLNPVMLIPFFLCPLMCVTVSYWAMNFGLIAKTTGVIIPWTTPPIISGFLTTNDWRAAVLQAILLIVCGLIYYPFIKSLDKKMLLEESES